jgi:hypothetical protein
MTELTETVADRLSGDCKMSLVSAQLHNGAACAAG